MANISVTLVEGDKVKVVETTISGESKTMNEYTISKDIYLSNLIRDKATLTQQIIDAQNSLSDINVTIDQVSNL